MLEVSKSQPTETTDPSDQDNELRGLNWKTIIFIPFSIYWMLTILFLVFIGDLMVLFNLTFEEAINDDIEENLFVLTEVFYYSDTLLHIMHNILRNQRVLNVYLPKKKWHLALDVLSLIPLDIIYKNLVVGCDSMEGYMFTYRALRLRVLLRTYRIGLFFNDVIETMGVNEMFGVFMSHIFSVTLYTHLVAVSLYLLSNFVSPNWTYILDDFTDFNTTNLWDWYFVSFFVANGFTHHSPRGDMKIQNLWEQTLLPVIVLTFFVGHIMYFFGCLLPIMKKYNRRKLTIALHVKQVKAYLKAFKVERRVRKQTVQYFERLWDYRYGIKATPLLFHRLPSSLQTDIKLDIFWDAFKHSKLFRVEDIPLKKALCLQMKSEFHVPGDFLFKPTRMKNRLIYIYSGVLQIYTTEDDESPILSFSSGTCFSTMSLLLQLPSVVFCKCATFCQILTLDIKSFYKILEDFPGTNHRMRDELNRRLTIARGMNEIVKKEKVQIIKSTFVEILHQESSALWFKERWRQILLSHLKSKTQPVNVKKELKELTAMHHNSEFMDLYVLSEAVELKLKVNFLSGTFPFVLDPKSDLLRYWHYFALSVITISCLIFPYYIFFVQEMTPAIHQLSVFNDIINYIDIFIQCSTAIKSRGIIISKWSQIAKYRIQEFPFIIDMIATFPANYSKIVIKSMSSHISALLYTNRLLRVYKIVKYFMELESLMEASIHVTRLAKYVVVHFIFYYWWTCVVYLVACYNQNCAESSWVLVNPHLKDALEFDENRMAFTLYYVLGTQLVLGNGQIFPNCLIDLCCNFILITCNYFIFSFIFTEYCVTMILSDSNKKTFTEFVSSIMMYLAAFKTPSNIRKNLSTYLVHQWDQSEGATISRLEPLLVNAPDNITRKAKYDKIIASLEKIPLFQNTCYDLLLRLAQVAHSYIIPPGSVVVQAGCRPSDIFFVFDGYCRLESSLPSDQILNRTSIIGPDSHFPMLEVLYDQKSLITVTTLSTCCLIAFDYRLVRKVMKLFPAFDLEINEAVEERRNFFQNIFSVGANFLNLPSPLATESQINMFDFDYVESKEIARRQWADGYKHLGSLRIFKFLLLPRTFSPFSKFILWWEIIRTISIISCIAITPSYFGVLNTYTHLRKLRIFYELHGCVDIYIRMHIGFYNSRAIYISHPACTAEQYFKTAFVTDLLSILPYDWVGLDLLFGKENQRLTFCVLITCTRLLLLYRPYGLIRYFQHETQFYRFDYLRMLIRILLICLLLNTYAHIKVLVDCNEDLECAETFGNTEYERFVWSFYAAVCSFAKVTNGLFHIGTVRQLYVFIAECLLMCCLRWLFYVDTISYAIGGNVNLTLYQNQLSNFLRFAESELLYEGIITETVNHFEYIWQRTKGNDISLVMKKLHMALKEDIVMFLYAPCLKRVTMFESVDEKFLKILGTKLQEEYFLKNAKIIRTNDLQGRMYFIYRGSVEVKVGETSIISLFPGAMFGCFNPIKKMRHRMAIIARENTDLLYIESKLFYELIKTWPLVQVRMEKAMILAPEFIESLDNTKSAVPVPATVEPTLASNEPSKTDDLLPKKHLSIVRKVKTVVTQADLKETQKWYSYWYQTVHVFFGFVSTMLIVIHIGARLEDRYTLLSIYLIDLIFMTKVYLGFRTGYIDDDGNVEIQIHQISLRYVSSFSKFWFDILTTFPFEIFVLLFPQSVDLFLWLKINRLGRFYFLLRNYIRATQRVSISQTTRWIYFMFWLILSITVATAMWIHLVCDREICQYHGYQEVSQEPPVITVHGKINIVLLGFLSIVNIFTGAGLQNINPINEFQAVILVFIILGLQSMLLFLGSNMASFMLTKSYSQGVYEYHLDNLLHYLQDREVSPILIKKVDNYSIQMWNRQGGSWLPEIITMSPRYIRQDIMHDLYGHHLLNSRLFQSSHMHFLQQLVTRLQRCMYFPGDYIVKKGEVNHCMYFIHTGDVFVVDEVDGEDRNIEILSKNSQFGLVQGLHALPHVKTYKARSVADILFLKRDNWLDLLEAFPASREEIDRRSVEIGPEYAPQPKIRQKTVRED